MKITRLLTYATAGMIVGLLIENQALIINKYAGMKARKLEKKVKSKFS